MNQITDFFKKLLDSADWPARWHCGTWTDFHGWLYIISDLLVWSAYSTIPFIIIKYITKKHDAKFVRLYFLFAAFILACGATHFIDAAAFWIPVYRLNALVRLITGILSWITVYYLAKFLPVAFSLKSQSAMEMEIDLRHQEILQANEQLHHLSSHLVNIREEERIEIARDIHDELGQQLTGIKMEVSWLRNKIATNDESIKQKINGITELIDETVRSVRRISSHLRPSILDDLGLLPALEWHSEEVAKRSGLRIIFTSDIQQVAIPDTVATSMFRIYQEVLTNVIRHANACEIVSSLQLADARLILRIADDGKGIDKQAATGTQKTLGLIGIKERTFALGGKYELRSEPGKGTEVIIDIPFVAPS